MGKTKNNIENSFKKLDGILEYLSQDAGLDIDEALKKVKEGSLIIKDLEKRLMDAKNEFEEVRQSMV
ncbi:MAG TPA: exodeoxyribonuclease VII small subunit [Patescibacteria group bacterium]|nr:exodeoxyribonuclease VII small subunit [Patescibacteria group bacterium]